MAIQEFTLPDPGEGLVEAEIVTWHVAAGDTVDVNQVVLEIETAKSLVELPIPWAGTVASILVPEGETVEVGTPIVTIDVGDDTAPADDGAAGAANDASGAADGGEVAAEIAVVVPAEDDERLARAAAGLARELDDSLAGFHLTIGRSRRSADPVDLYRAGNEALLAANVAEAGPDDSVLAFEETGAYRLLLPAMSEDPAELQRFYAETVAPLVAYDDQYETDLVQTLETFLDADGNVAGTAARLFTHRHTVRYEIWVSMDRSVPDLFERGKRRRAGCRDGGEPMGCKAA